MKTHTVNESLLFTIKANRFNIICIHSRRIKMEIVSPNWCHERTKNMIKIKIAFVACWKLKYSQKFAVLNEKQPFSEITFFFSTLFGWFNKSDEKTDTHRIAVAQWNFNSMKSRENFLLALSTILRRGSAHTHIGNFDTINLSPSTLHTIGKIVNDQRTAGGELWTVRERES